MIRIARLRRAATKYLRDGVFLRPPDRCGRYDDSHLTIVHLRRPARGGAGYTQAAPIVLTSAWQAADGSVAIALANLSHASVPVHLALEPPDYPLASQGVIRQILPRESVEVGRYQDGRASLDITLDPADVRIYEFLK